MAGTNGFFGNIQGPFAANEELFTKIQEKCKNRIDYISKLGIHYVGNFNLDLIGTKWQQYFVKINGIEFQIGMTRMLELEDVRVNSIQFVQDTDELWYIDYQYHKYDEDNNG